LLINKRGKILSVRIFIINELIIFINYLGIRNLYIEVTFCSALHIIYLLALSFCRQYIRRLKFFELEL
jgi:hypothetical protein